MRLVGNAIRVMLENFAKPHASYEHWYLFNHVNYFVIVVKHHHILYSSRWDLIPDLMILRDLSMYFHIASGVTIYVLATLLVLISFAIRTRSYGTESGDSFIKTFLKLLYTYMFIFTPPVAYLGDFIPYVDAHSLKKNRPMILSLWYFSSKFRCQSHHRIAIYLTCSSHMVTLFLSV
ncbi:unnamed protein product [Adineta ricciae]|uniref:Uncharacterized protein n=1 Tax=Adineta ricciae TaxID=249248 RepID=A0A816DQ65_ADIRI|nr:unnamed protein product [Adineta ricciae]